MSPLLLALALAATPSLGPVEAQDLEGRAVQVPGRLAGSLQLLLVAFERDRADALDRTFGELQPLERKVPGLVVYQAPVIGAVNGVLQAVIRGAQQLSLPRDRHGRYLPLFVDRKEVMARLGVADPRECVALLTRGKAVLAVLPGACQAGLGPAVEAAVAAASPPAAPLPAAL